MPTEKPQRSQGTNLFETASSPRRITKSCVASRTRSLAQQSHSWEKVEAKEGLQLRKAAARSGWKPNLSERATIRKSRRKTISPSRRANPQKVVLLQKSSVAEEPARVGLEPSKALRLKPLPLFFFWSLFPSPLPFFRLCASWRAKVLAQRVAPPQVHG